jgi:hypothetical protein
LKDIGAPNGEVSHLSKFLIAELRFNLFHALLNKPLAFHAEQMVT